MILVIAALLAPVALIGSWVRAELIDTDRFVQTFAPLAREPAVQSFVADQAVAAVEANVDIDGIVASVFANIESLDLPPKATAAVGLLEGPAVQGIRSMVRSSVDALVSAEQFAQVWAFSLRETHARAIAVIQGDETQALQLSQDGTLTVELGTVVAAVRQSLIDNGMGLAVAIPEIDRSIPIVASDSLVAVRTVSQLATVVGVWLPWVVCGLLIAGIALARNRFRAACWAGIGLTGSFSSRSASRCSLCS